MLKQKMGIIIILIALCTFTIERVTKLISTFLGKLICGDQYLSAVDGVVGDFSCGFNTDMYLAVALLIIFILGILLVISSKK